MRDIINEKWDILVVLDACRYDIFKEVYPAIFPNGTLSLETSLSTNTVDWHKLVFTGKDCSDIVVITPIILFDQIASGHNAFKVIGTWKTHWDNDYSIVKPAGTNEVALKSLKEYPEKRFIIHYMQPHIPYFTYPPPTKYKPMPHDLDDEGERILKTRIRKGLSDKLTKYRIPCTWLWRISNLMGKNTYVAQIYYDSGGWSGIRKAYTDNLLHVLSYVQTLHKECNGRKMIITGDHGERLGEGGLFGHSSKKMDKAVIEVPWFEVK